ncbi:hypothetical protein [Streptomyces sp. NPDC059378]|uniref:hypothetical protein n=1 Tax=Streptomyces sp. NPDC059378 TaxID=3346815 RepID=UPI0036A60AF7
MAEGQELDLFRTSFNNRRSTSSPDGLALGVLMVRILGAVAPRRTGRTGLAAAARPGGSSQGMTLLTTPPSEALKLTGTCSPDDADAAGVSEVAAVTMIEARMRVRGWHSSKLVFCKLAI